MITSNLSRVPAELQQKKDPIAEGGAQGPMSQQDAANQSNLSAAQPSWLICSSVTTRSTFSVSLLMR